MTLNDLIIHSKRDQQLPLLLLLQVNDVSEEYEKQRFSYYVQAHIKYTILKKKTVFLLDKQQLHQPNNIQQEVDFSQTSRLMCNLTN